MSDWLRGLAIAGCAGAFLAFSGSMGTGELSLGARLLYWLPLMLIMTIVAIGCCALLELAPARPKSPLLMGLLVTFAIAIPGTLVVWIYTSAFEGMRFAPSRLLVMFGPTLLISAAMTGINMLSMRPGVETHGVAGNGVSGSAPERTLAAFFHRLPPNLRAAQIRAVKAEDHYLRVYTSMGEHLLLCRLADALRELDGVEGAQTHRSWWVAKEAVVSAVKGDGKATLHLAGGIVAPVSRANVKALREAGWI